MEPGTKNPKALKDAAWAVLCPVLYCSANPDNPCMTPIGLFALNTHIKRKVLFEKPSKDAGPGNWNRRPVGELEQQSRFDREVALSSFFADVSDFQLTDRDREKWEDKQYTKDLKNVNFITNEDSESA